MRGICSTDQREFMTGGIIVAQLLREGVPTFLVDHNLHRHPTETCRLILPDWVGAGCSFPNRQLGRQQRQSETVHPPNSLERDLYGRDRQVGDLGMPLCFLAKALRSER